VDEEDREDGPNLAHLQQVWNSTRSQSASVGRFHRRWDIFFEIVEEWVQYVPQLKRAAAMHGSSEFLSDCKHHQWHNHAFDNLAGKLHDCAIHVLQMLRWWNQEAQDVA
jgi:hypothetical protein